MTFLPIVERELRAASRRHATFVIRIRIACAAAVGVGACALASLIAPSVTFGPTLFWGLSWLCMIYCLFAGRLMTADCLSREKREGTLGLLFLTDLNGYDIVLGKLAATSLTGFYVLIAVLPFLAVPFLAGGMTSGELWRMALVLVNTFLFSLAVGVFASSVSRDQRKAMGANLLLLLALTLGLPAVAGGAHMASRLPPIQELLYPCPIYAFMQCADKKFTFSPGNFWWSLATTLDLTIILTILACHTAPRTWKDKFTRRRLSQKDGHRSESASESGVKAASPFRRRLLNRNAYLWLASRPQRKVLYVWAMVILVGCWWMIPEFFFPGIKVEAAYALAAMLSVAFKLWITVEAGHQLAEDKKSGAFELLLTTPMSMREIVRGQWLSLRRQFLAPLLISVAFELALMTVLPYRPSELIPGQFIWPALIVMLGADLVTLSWAAMSSALTEKSHDVATMKTFLFVLIVPSLLLAVVAALRNLWITFSMYGRPDGEWKFYLAWWFVLGLCADSIVFVRARKRLQARFARNLPESAAPVPQPDSVAVEKKLNPTPPRTRRQKLRRIAIATAVVAMLGVVAVLCAISGMHIETPKPLIVSISRSNNPIRISGSYGYISILPDGTLWRWGHAHNASPPEQIGTNNNWIQASVRGETAAGLRTDGTLWKWNIDKEGPKQFGADHDWAQASAASETFAAMKRDGSLWNLTEVDYENSRHGPAKYELLQVGTNYDWKAVTVSAFGLRLALRADGTLWIWGGVRYVSFGISSYTNYPEPIQLCREDNWVGFCDGIPGGIRNQSGQIWSLTPLLKRPGPQVSISALGRELPTNTTSAGYALCFDNGWTLSSCETRSDGSLWATSTSWKTGYQPNGIPVHFGGRSDWVSVWGAFDSAIGLTADGVLWTWGKDYGQPAHYEFVEKLEMIREEVAILMGTPPRATSILSIHDECGPYYPQKIPRPLLKLVFTNSPADR